MNSQRPIEKKHRPRRHTRRTPTAVASGLILGLGSRGQAPARQPEQEGERSPTKRCAECSALKTKGASGMPGDSPESYVNDYDVNVQSIATHAAARAGDDDAHGRPTGARARGRRDRSSILALSSRAAGRSSA